jgi:DNA processing protein
MVTTLNDERVVSPYDELIAYEYLYAMDGTSRGKMSRELAENGTLPTRAMAAIAGLMTNESKYGEVRNYVNSRLGGFSVLVEGTPQFPRSLRAQKDPLPVFYYRGNLSLVESRCVSVVETRHPSERGALAARRIARALAGRDITVVAGLAAGIDTEAMTEAISSGGSVIGVIGTPIDKYYPKENRTLQDEVAAKHLLISQVPIYRYDHQPFDTQRFYFSERNVTMAALSEATIIVEAGETSGTRTQARACIDQGKKLVFLPGVIESVTWTQAFLENGAEVASSVTEAMELIG